MLHFLIPNNSKLKIFGLCGSLVAALNESIGSTKINQPAHKSKNSVHKHKKEKLKK